MTERAFTGERIFLQAARPLGEGRKFEACRLRWSKSQAEMQTERDGGRAGTSRRPIEAYRQYCLNEINLEQSSLRLDRPALIHKRCEAEL
jgi:hypothetical protein